VNGLQLVEPLTVTDVAVGFEILVPMRSERAILRHRIAKPTPPPDEAGQSVEPRRSLRGDLLPLSISVR